VEMFSILKVLTVGVFEINDPKSIKLCEKGVKI